MWGSLLQNPAAPQYSHAYFSSGVTGFLQSFFATHPPLEQRIARIDPSWDGKFITPELQETDAKKAAETKAAIHTAVIGGAVAAGMLTPDAALELVGKLKQEKIDLAQDILGAIPGPLRQASEEPFGACAVIYALLLDPKPDILAKQQTLLSQLEEPALSQHTSKLMTYLTDLPESARLPLVELTVPVLRTLSLDQYRRFRAVVQVLISADRKVDMKEWILRQFLIRQLDESFKLRQRPKPKYGILGAVKREAEILLSLAAHCEHADAVTAEQAFRAGIKAVGATALKFMPHEELTLEKLNKAIDKLEELKPLLKSRVLKACAACLMHDGKATIKGQELLRTVASCLDCPMPPLARENTLAPVKNDRDIQGNSVRY